MVGKRFRRANRLYTRSPAKITKLMGSVNKIQEEERCRWEGGLDDKSREEIYYVSSVQNRMEGCTGGASVWGTFGCKR